MAIQVELAPTALSVRRILDAQLIDSVVHTWDIAQALGRRFTSPEPLLATVASIGASIPDKAYGNDAAFAVRLHRPSTTWAATLALTGRHISEED
jgi:hypothetical protein